MAGNAQQTVDPKDEPSAEWGWHGGFRRGTVIAGWVSVIALLAMNFGNHTGRVENIWVTGAAVVLAVALIIQAIRQRTSWRR